ncbi:MAG: hypothetical protein AAGF71_12395 [Pseudomonadota bacterium]
MTKTLLLSLSIAALSTASMAQSLSGLASSALGGGASSAIATEAAKAALGNLSADSFDPAMVRQMIDGSGLDDATKGTLNQAVDAAEENPEMVQTAIDQVKAAFGV